MSLLKKTAYLFFLLPQLVWSVGLSWSGSSRLDSYYKHEGLYYGGLNLSADSKLHIKDGLDFHVRWDLVGVPDSINNLWDEFVFSQDSALFYQKGFVFFYKGETKRPVPFILPSQFYLTYGEEFFKFQAGRAPRHFGLGITYHALDNPFNFWVSVLDQLSIYAEYNQFYLQSSLFYYSHKEETKRDWSALLELGFTEENWQVSAFYEYKRSADSFVELYGTYKQNSLDLKASYLHVFSSETSFLLALESAYRLFYKIPIDLEFKAGGAFGSASFHTQYNVALILWNRFVDMETEETSNQDSSYQIAKGQIQEAFYLSPRVGLYFLNESLKIQPLVLVAGHLDKKLSYELDLEGSYKWDENIFLNLTAGALYQKEWELALMAQAAVSF